MMAAMNSVRYSVSDGVAKIVLDNPPLNALSHDLRRSIVAGLDRAVADPKVRAIVLSGNERAFSSGADIKEFSGGAFYAAPFLPAVCDIVEAAPKPVIAAISGACMGGGLELALSCHYRLARADAKIAFPEVKLGLIPGAGGTQRFPRLVGLEAAINTIASGATVPASAFAGTSLWDLIVKDDLEAATTGFVTKLLEAGQGVRRVRNLPARHPQSEAFLQFARGGVKAAARGMQAPLRAVDAIAAAFEEKFDRGMAKEASIFGELMIGSESKSLRHAFFAERAAAKITGLKEGTRERKIESVAIVGAGTMGGGIAMTFANAGIPVTLLEAKQEALDRGIAGIRKQYESQVAKGKLKSDDAAKRIALIQPALDFGAAAKADLFIEAVFEDLAVKKEVFSKLDKVARRGAILATNTSTLDVDAIAAFTKRPGDVLGLHFFSPANIMKLLEVVRGAKTLPDVLATSMSLARRIGKTAVVSGVCDGFIGNRMLEQYVRQGLFMLEEGATPAQIDKALEKFGFAMGPFRMYDLAGNDIGWHIRKRRYVEQPQIKYARIADLICELGRFGQKTGAGWYRYEAGKRDAIPDPLVEELIVKERTRLGLKPRRLDDAEIVDRLVYALVNEGAKILEEGIAQRASDLDVVYLFGYGFPPTRGGPMFHASQVGLANVVRRMHEFAANPHGDPAFWKPVKLLARLAESGASFDTAPAAAPAARAPQANPKSKARPRKQAKPGRKPAAKGKRRG
jgi:3-hydroxyacyl-CoA dehydrogenase